MPDNRFMRTEALLGSDALKKLRNSTVMIVGVGAVGGYALEALARAGVGKFVIVDFDVFDITNINRQILALSSTVGRKKIDVAQERLLDINPKAKVKTLDLFVNDETIPQILKQKVDFVIDAIDSLNPKCQLAEALYSTDIPFISSMGAAIKTDPSKIFYGSLNQTKNCGLAKFMRKRLKKRGLDLSKICCVSSTEQCSLPETAIFETKETPTQGRKRNTLGSLPTITAIFGLTIANEVIKTLTLQ